MNSTDHLLSGELQDLLLATLHMHVDPSARISRITSTAMDAGLSGATVLRHRIKFASEQSRDGSVSLITKDTTLIERRVLALLQDQEESSVPFNYAPNLVDDIVLPVCMEDLGRLHRPTSRDPIPPELIEQEAAALARIHHVNLGQSKQFAWLPRVDRRYVQGQLARTWEPAWRRAVEIDAFRREFGDQIPTVEAAAAAVADEIEQVSMSQDCLTLLHGDLNPSNVLISSGQPRFIDWQAACYGPFYLDLPHHLFTLELAEVYRHVREELGEIVDPDDFAAGYRAASHYIGLRYIWWTLELWQEDRAQSPWVRYYLELIAL